jgi:hypothetical protein
MPVYSINNENFRDEVLKHSYPFDERATLEDDNVYIGTDLFIDAVFYVKEPTALPLSIRVVDGTAGLGRVKLIIADRNGMDIGVTVVSHEVVNGQVTNSAGIPTGAVIFNAEALSRFIGRVAGNTFVLLPHVASFLLEVCHVSKVSQFRYALVNGRGISGTVKVVARHGCRFVKTATGLRLDVVGSPPALSAERIPVRSINGVKSQAIWLAGHPRSNLRISNADGGIKFIQAQDAT